MDNKFEQFIQQSMDHPTGRAFDERLWKDMEKRLDHGKGQDRGAGLWKGLPWLLLTFLMTSLAGYFYVKQYKAIERIAVVEEKLAAALSTPTVEQSEKRQTTILYDTIYRTVVLDEYVRQQKSMASSGQNALWIKSSLDFLEQAEKNIPALLNGKKGSIQAYATTAPWAMSANSLKEEMEDDLKSNYRFDWAMAADEVPTLILEEGLTINRVTELPALEVMRNRQRKDVRFYLSHLRPTRFALAGTTGTFASLNLGGSGFNLRGSAHGELGLGSRFSIQAGVEYFSNDFTRRIEPEDIEPLEGFPNLPANNEEDVLTEIQGDFNYLQLPFGIKYVVFPQRYVDPYIGVGLIYGKTTRSRLEYEYLSPIGPYSISEGRLLPNLFELNALYGTLGVQIQMNKHWSLLLEGSGQMDIKQGVYKYENLELLKLNTGVMYQF